MLDFEFASAFDVLDTSGCIVVVVVPLPILCDGGQCRKIESLFDPPTAGHGHMPGVMVKWGRVVSAGNLEIARKVTDRA